jgi:hypothetical protein
MSFLMQPFPFPGLGLAPPMAPIMVEAGELAHTIKCLENKCKQNYQAIYIYIILIFVRQSHLLSSLRTNPVPYLLSSRSGPILII